MQSTEPGAQAVTVAPARRRRRWHLFLLAAGLLLLVWFFLDLTYVLAGAEDDYATHADVIIVLGCNIVGHGGPSPCIAARAGHAADLFKAGFAPRIIATGGPSAGPDGPTESEVLQSVLESDGVPSSDIVQENRALDTIQNMAFSQAIMREYGWNSAIIVTEPFHIKRATLIAHDDGMTVFPSPAVNSPNWRDFPQNAFNVGRDTLSLMLYQVKALTGDHT